MSAFTPVQLNLGVTVAAAHVAVGEASGVIPEDTVDVADFWAPGLNYSVLKPYGRYARFIVRGVEALPSLTAYVLIPWGPPVTNTMQAWQRGFIVLRYLPPKGINQAFVDVRLRLRRIYDANHQVDFPLAEHPSFLFRRVLVYKRYGDKFGRIMSFSLVRYRAMLQQFMALGDTHVVLNISLTFRQPEQTSRLPNMPIELLNLLADKMDLASVVQFARTCKALRLGVLGRDSAVRLPTSPMSLEFAPPTRQLPLTHGPSLLGNRVSARVVRFLEPLFANGRARSVWLGSVRYAMAMGNIAIISEGVRAIIDSASYPQYNYFFVVTSPAAHLIYEELVAAGLSRMPGTLNIDQPAATMHTLERRHNTNNSPACMANVIETEPGRGGIINTVRCLAPTTATMNFITYENIVCLVPSLTLKKRFAINTMRHEIPWFDLGPAVVRLVKSGYVAVGEFPREFYGEEAWVCPW